MSQLTALSISIGVLGAVWAYLALGPLAAYVLVWAGFIAWGCFFHTGGTPSAFTKTVVGTIYGAIVGWVALLIIAKVSVPALGALWPAIVVGITVFALVIVASTDLLSVVPVQVYGYAAIVGYTTLTKSFGALTEISAANPLIILIVSLLIGAIFGYLSAQLANTLSGKKA